MLCYVAYMYCTGALSKGRIKLLKACSGKMRRGATCVYACMYLQTCILLAYNKGTGPGSGVGPNGAIARLGRCCAKMSDGTSRAPGRLPY